MAKIIKRQKIELERWSTKLNFFVGDRKGMNEREALWREAWWAWCWNDMWVNRGMASKYKQPLLTTDTGPGCYYLLLGSLQ